MTKTSSASAAHNNGSTTTPTRSQSPPATPTEQHHPNRLSQPRDDPPRNDLFHANDYSSLLDEQPTSPSPHVSIDTLPFSSYPTEIAEAAKSLCEPLLITEEPNIQPMEADPLAEPESCTLDLSNILSNASLDLTTDDNLHHVNMRPPPPSPYVTPVPVPAANAVHSPVRRTHTPAQHSITAAVAAAATAAAEMYLLNTGPHANASHAKASMVDVGRVVDPGGVAAAATAAAEVEMSSLSSQALDSRVQQRVPLLRHVSEPILPLRAAAQQHVFDEAMRRLDMDLVKHRVKDEIHVVGGQQHFGTTHGQNNVLASGHEYANFELGRRLAGHDIERQREELAAFASLRPLQFDQTLSSSQAFESSIDFSAHHGADDH
ncbi:hypothetical protein FGB62_61g157 [Gracilaria domingensis]|nr:hypothetical protein FGB62_61g157 [Gracilaria domingensis]